MKLLNWTVLNGVVSRSINPCLIMGLALLLLIFFILLRQSWRWLSILIAQWIEKYQREHHDTVQWRCVGEWVSESHLSQLQPWIALAIFRSNANNCHPSVRTGRRKYNKIIESNVLPMRARCARTCARRLSVSNGRLMMMMIIILHHLANKRSSGA